jgi:ABC-2 type transport system permease protein
MNRPKFFQKPADEQRNRIASQGGSYSLVLTAIILAILIVVNLLVSVLPANLTKLDISSSKLYSITSNTKVVVNALDQDVTIYWIVQSGEEDDVIDNLLSKYESLSSHIEVVKKNPDVYPTFAAQYTDETVANNSLIVVSGERYRYIAYDDIYLSDTSSYYSYYTSTVTAFDGEGAITSAIDYVVNEQLPQAYLLEGHGESDLPSIFSDQVEKENIETSTLSLLTVDEIPEDAACIVIYAPTSDISEAEAEMLREYVSDGGKLLVMAGPTQDSTLDNLYSVIADYGVTPCEGIIIEADRDHYISQAPYILMPDMNSHDITDSLIDDHYYPILPIAGGLTISDSTSGATVTSLLTTSDTAFSKIAGYALTTYDEEDGDIDGPFSVAVSIECSGGGQIVWFCSSNFLDDTYNAYSSGANGDLAMNAMADLIGESEAMAIRSKSLSYNYLTISDSTATRMKIVMIGVLPIAYLGIGICVVCRRREKQNETV